MTKYLWCVVLLLPFLAVGCGQELKEFVSKEGRFKILLPGTPKEQTQATAAGTFKMYLAGGKSSGYMAGYADMPIPPNEPDAQVQMRLDGAVQGAANNTHGSVTNKSAILLENKYPGREVLIALPDREHFIRGRIYLVGVRLYQVLAIGTRSWVDSSDTKKVLESFALLK